MIERNFKTHSLHLEGCDMLLSTKGSRICTVGTDEIMCIMHSSNETPPISIELKSQKKERVTTMDLHPQKDNVVVLGMTDGLTLLCQWSTEINLHQSLIIYRSEGKINKVAFSRKGQLILIAGSEQSLVLYDCKQGKFTRLNQPHSGLLLNMFTFDLDDENQLVATLGTDARLHIYYFYFQTKLKKQPFNESEPLNPSVSDALQGYQDCLPSERKETQKLQTLFVDKYAFAVQTFLKQAPAISVTSVRNYQQDASNPSQLRLLVGGQTTLQQVDLYAAKHENMFSKQNQLQVTSKYSLHLPICQESEILLVSAVNQDKCFSKIVVTTTKNHLSLWDYLKNEKKISIRLNQFSLKNSLISQIECFENSTKLKSFVLCCKSSTKSNGKLYQFVNYQLLKAPELNPAPNSTNQNEIEQSKNYIATNPAVQPKIFIPKVVEESYAAMLLSQYPQLFIEKSYEEHMNSRYLFYNCFGCVIQRFEDEQNSTIELNFHDKSRISKIKLNDNNSSFYCFFALTENAFLRASPTHLIFQEQKLLRSGFEWKYIWSNIQGVCISASWIAAANDQQIKIFDYFGNQLHSICFDRVILALEAYEDVLAVVYHFDTPIWGCQNIKMKLFEVDCFTFKSYQDVLVPIQPNSLMKWFGFSQEGMIYCQDSHQILRAYNYQNEEWTVVCTFPKKCEHLYIQHIENYQIYGFRIDQTKEEFEVQPRVMPPDLPRKISLELPALQARFVSADEAMFVRRLMFRNWKLRHQQFRHERWYKYKYSRTKDHHYHAYSATISSEEELQTCRTEIDIQLLDYLRKFTAKVDKSADIGYELLSICMGIVHSDDVLSKIKEIIERELNCSLPALRLARSALLHEPPLTLKFVEFGLHEDE